MRARLADRFDQRADRLASRGAQPVEPCGQQRHRGRVLDAPRGEGRRPLPAADAEHGDVALGRWLVRALDLAQREAVGGEGAYAEARAAVLDEGHVASHADAVRGDDGKALDAVDAHRRVCELVGDRSHESVADGAQLDPELLDLGCVEACELVAPVVSNSSQPSSHPVHRLARIVS